VPHESVLNSLASTFNPLVPGWDESVRDRCQSAYLSTQHGRRPPPPSWVVTEAPASAAGVVLANCGAIDAMVATLVDVESLEVEALDWLLSAVPRPERPPMTLVAF
jgi:hypothetical protein